MKTSLTFLLSSAVILAGGVTTSAFAQSAKEVRGGTPYATIADGPAAKLTVDPPLAEALAQGFFWAQYRAENVRIVQVFGGAGLDVSPRIGHLHIYVDDLPWI